MSAVELDVQYPAGIKMADNPAGEIDEDVLVSTVTTNLFGPIRMSSALMEHLKSNEEAVILVKILT